MPRAARGVALCVAALLISPAVPAMPENTPWGRAPGEICVFCHFDRQQITESAALVLEGLPARLRAGASYPLLLRLSSDGIKRAGFRIVAASKRGDAGTFSSVDARTESDRDRLRSTLAGTELAVPGAAQWYFTWTAPARIAGKISFEISVNAADDDGSPLGDVIHVLTLQR